MWKGDQTCFVKLLPSHFSLQGNQQGHMLCAPSTNSTGVRLPRDVLVPLGVCLRKAVCQLALTACKRGIYSSHFLLHSVVFQTAATQTLLLQQTRTCGVTSSLKRRPRYTELCTMMMKCAEKLFQSYSSPRVLVTGFKR